MAAQAVRVLEAIDFGVSRCDDSDMRNRSRNLKEIHQIADAMVEMISAGRVPPTADGKDPIAVAMGRRGGLKGGKARAANMTKAQRSESAKKAAIARWSTGVQREGEAKSCR